MVNTTHFVNSGASQSWALGRVGLFGSVAARAAAMPPEVAGQLRAQQITAIGRLGQPMMAANLINTGAFLLVMAIEDQLTPIAIAWACVMWLFAMRAFFTWRRRSARPLPQTASQRAIRRSVMSALMFGLLWSIPALTFFPHLSGMSLGFGGALLTGMIAGGAIVLYPVPMAALAFGIPIVLSSTFGIFLVHGWVALGPAIIAGTFLYVFGMAIQRHADLFLTEFVGRLELQKRNRLIEDLLQDARLEVIGSRRESEERMLQAKKMEAVGQLTSGIAHDFNNLLTAIRGNAELLEVDGKSDVHLIDAILQASDRGARQVQRLLSIAQKQRLAPEHIELAALFKDVDRIVAPTIAPGLLIECTVAPGTPAVRADAAQLENALINLIFNARDAMPDGGVIELQAHRSAGKGMTDFVDVLVRDTGCGMEVATLERALDPFFTTKAFGHGSGLGLPSVAGFARQSGGDVTIKSHPGRGTCVTLRLPMALDEAADQDTDTPCATQKNQALTSILVVEDTQDVLRVVEHVLQGEGYTVSSVEDAESALELLETAPLPDLVLTDIILAGSMTGFQLAKQMHTRYPQIAVRFMSALPFEAANGETHTQDRALLRKPFTRQELLSHVREALDAEVG